MRPVQFAILLLSLFSALFSVSVISPVQTAIEEGSQITIGDVGPGQTFAVVAAPKESSGGKYGLGGSYDQLLATSLPDGWASTPSKLYGNPLQTDVTVPKDAPDGDYVVALTLWDEAGSEGLGNNVSFDVVASVKREVMDMKIEPSSLSVGAGQPARFAITVNNKGIANDVFTISSSGVRDWEFQRSIYIPSGTSKTVSYEVAGSEEADYKVRITARSSSSDAISSSGEVSLRVNTDLFSDYRATNRGVLLFPMTEAPLYFVAGLLSNLLPA